MQKLFEQVDVLPHEADSSISMLQPDEKPDISYADIGGMDMQKQEVIFYLILFWSFSCS